MNDLIIKCKAPTGTGIKQTIKQSKKLSSLLNGITIKIKFNGVKLKVTNTTNTKKTVAKYLKEYGDWLNTYTK